MSESQGRSSTKCKYFLAGGCSNGEGCRFSHAGGGKSKRNPTNYKTVMCSNFERTGFCTVGPTCSFAHGENELRSGAMKHILCQNWEESRSCKYGKGCHYAHGESELEEFNKAKIVAANPLYKTQLCSRFKEDGFCDIAENCSFAHGDDELRKVSVKQVVPCKFIAKNGACPNGDSCNFSHAKDNRRNQPHPGMFMPGMLQQQQQQMMGGPMPTMTDMTDPLFKTTICKGWLENKKCQFEGHCKHAHGEADLRPVPDKQPGFKDTICKYFEEDGKCKWGKDCKFAHGKKEFHKYNVRPGQYSSMCKQWIEKKCIYGYNCQYSHDIPNDNRDWKVVQCKSVKGDKQCSFGDKCGFFHVDRERRTRNENLEHMEFRRNLDVMKKMMKMGGQAMMGQSMMGGQQAMMGGQQAMMGGQQAMMGGQQNMMGGLQNMMGGQQNMMGGQQSIMGGQQNMMGNMRSQDGCKTMACEAIVTTGRCPNGNNCRYAHSEEELMNSRNLSKSVLCPTWLEDGSCMNPNCEFAHGKKEMQMGNSAAVTSPQKMMNLNIEAGRGMRENGLSSFGDRDQFSFPNMGGLKRDFQEMSRARGQNRFEPVLDGKYKVVLCDKYPNNCDQGERCHYAHGYEELSYYRIKQVPNYKRTLCKSWEETRNCQWERTCMFAHGVDELRSEENRGTSYRDTPMSFNKNKDFAFGHSEPKRKRY